MNNKNDCANHIVHIDSTSRLPNLNIEHIAQARRKYNKYFQS